MAMGRQLYHYYNIMTTVKILLYWINIDWINTKHGYQIYLLLLKPNIL